MVVFSFFPFFFFKTTTSGRQNLTVLWNNGDYSKAIKFFKCYLHLLHSFLTLQILMTDVIEAKTSTNGKTIKNEYHLVLADTFKHFSVQQSFHFTFLVKMLMQCSKYAKHLLSHSPCRRHLILSSEIQMIKKKKIQDQQVSKCIVFCA